MQMFAVECGAELDFLVVSTGSGTSDTHVFILVLVVKVDTLQLGRSLAFGNTARFDGCVCISMC